MEQRAFLCATVNAKQALQKWKGWLEQCGGSLNSLQFSAKPLSLSLFDTVWCQNEKQQNIWKREREWQMKGHGAYFKALPTKAQHNAKQIFLFFYISTNDDMF